MNFEKAMYILDELASYHSSLINNDNEKRFLELMLKECNEGSRVEEYLIDLLTNDFNMKERCGYFSTSYQYYSDSDLHKNTWIAIAKLSDRVAKDFAKFEFKKAYRVIRSGKQPTNYIERKAAKSYTDFWRGGSLALNKLFKYYSEYGFDWTNINKRNRTINIHGRDTKIFNY